MKFDERLDAFADENPWPMIRWAVKWLFIASALLIGIKIVFFPVQYAVKAAAVVAAEIDPHVLLQKYMWFKDARAALDAKLASIKVYANRQTRLEKLYGSPTSWPRDVREEWSLQASELSGIIASYNALAADYNAQMAKINWRFTNVGGLPQGATETFPREYAPYKETM